MLAIILFLSFILCIDIYSFFGLKSFFADHLTVFYIVYFASVILGIIGIVTMFKMFGTGVLNQTVIQNGIIGLAFSIIVAKLFFTSFFLVEDIMRGFLWLFQSAVHFRLAEFISRSYVWGLASLIVGLTFMFLLNFGVWFGKYHYKVHHKVLEFENLPAAFDGFKIAQLSDQHLGTFDRKNKVQQGLDILKNQKADLLVFTGDMVNNKAEEALPYIEMFKELEAPYGKYTIWGNHDYGDYVRWKNDDEKDNNLAKLEQLEKQMGLEWLNNRNVPLTKDGDTIYLAGVENWGLRPFPQYGKFEEAIRGLNSDDFIVLLSHDPTHWSEVVNKAETKVELTLSGHTHGMQFGFEIGKYRWSPVKYKYKNWADFHEFNKRFLYVNRGFGHIGYPGRVGIRPEITVIELRRKLN
ncbi:MAG: metallophosphoesterase [Salinivirgaceae bacterium]|nr:metallophosphoesterase [Salinivirgaceae bacterium]